MFQLQKKSAPVAEPTTPSKESSLPSVTPAVDIWEDEHRVVVEADLPGVSQEGVEISVHRGVLTITGTPRVVDEGKLQPIYREYRPARFVRSFTLADDLDDQSVTAKMTDGVLRIELPRRADSKPRRIEVQAA
ncbi:heat-shock protein Hsp20 [Planctomycetota bacterium]|nr:heat-shock protein Hsp20 [Planctomycetota bacterium]